MNKDYVLEEIFDTISEGIVFHEAQGPISYVNKQAEEILGLTKDQILGKTPMDPFWRTYKEDMSPFDGADHPSTYTMKTQQEKRDVIMGIYKPDNSFVWININSKPLFQEGAFVGAVVTFSDVTQQYNDSKVMQAQSHYLDVTLKSAPIILFDIDMEGGFRYSKGSGLKALGLEDDMVVGLSAIEMYKDFPTIVQAVKDALEGKESHINQQVGDAHLLIHMVPTTDMLGQRNGLVGIGLDVTEQERSRKALLLQARQAQVGEMLSIIAHQWRQPLTAISATVLDMRLHLELGTYDVQNLIAQTEKADTTLQHLSETISNFKDFFKPDQQKELFSMQKVLDDVLSLLDGSLSSVGLQVAYRDESSGKKLRSYRHDIIQVMMNLLGNALDIVKTQDIVSPEVMITTKEQAEQMVIEVADNLGGIPYDIIDDVFLPYFTTKGELQGTGLGLYMCKNIIEGHCGGRLSVYNSSCGAVFNI